MLVFRCLRFFQSGLFVYPCSQGRIEKYVAQLKAEGRATGAERQGRRPARLVARIHESQLIASLNDGRRIVEDCLDRIPGHQEYEQRENRTDEDGLDDKNHTDFSAGY